MKKINCIIADDEPLARSILENYISRIDQLNFVAACSNGAEVFNAILNHSADLLFLDIKMPHISGIDLLKAVPSLPPVILTTAYGEYALESYEFNVIDYLVKPISFERFLQAIQKFNKTFSGPDNPPAPAPETLPNRPFIYVRSDKKMVKVYYDEILYIEGLKDYVQIILKSRKIITHQTLTSFEEKLPEPMFIRVHRSFIVAFPSITAFTARTIEIDDIEIPIGDSYLQTVSKRLV